MAYTGLAKTTFMAGPDDALAAADAYDVNDIVSASVDTVDYSLSLPESALGLKINPPGIPAIGLKVPKLDQVDIIKSAIEANSDVSIKNCFTNMGEEAKKLLSIPGKLLGKVEATINGVVTKIKNLGDKVGNLGDKLGNFDLNKALEKIGNIKAIGCTANSLSNGNYSLKVIDKGGLSGLISGITKEGSSLGINDIFSTISRTITDKDVLLGACKDILPMASRNIDLLKDLSSTDIKSSIKSMLPSISGDSIRNFRINPGTKNFELPGVYNNIKYTLNNIDSSWNNVVRSGERILSGINTVDKKAGDFHKVLESSVMYDYSLIPTPIVGEDISMPIYDSDEIFLLSTKDLGVQDVSTLLKDQFPSLPLIVNPITPVKPNKIYDITNGDTVFFESSENTNSISNAVKISFNSFTNTTTVTPEKIRL